MIRKAAIAEITTREVHCGLWSTEPGAERGRSVGWADEHLRAAAGFYAQSAVERCRPPIIPWNWFHPMQ